MGQRDVKSFPAPHSSSTSDHVSVQVAARVGTEPLHTYGECISTGKGHRVCWTQYVKAATETLRNISPSSK